MRSGIHQIEQDAREFRTDVLSVANNFLGENNWQAPPHTEPLPNEQGVTRNAWQQFQDAMMRDARFYSNESNIEDRIALGICTALFVIPYVPFRMMYDGALNTWDYAASRLNADQPFPDLANRRPNGYVLGAPLSLPFIATMAVLEGAGRMAGFSRYGRKIIEAAGKSAILFSSRYTSGILTEYNEYNLINEISSAQNVVFSPIETGWDLLDRVGLITLPGTIAALEITAAVAVTALGGTLEIIGRMAGISAYGLNVTEAAGKRAANISKRYTGRFLGKYAEEDIKKHEEVIFSLPHKGWEAADRVGLVTFPAVIAAVEITGAVAFTGIAGILETIGRMAGFSAYGRNIIEAAGKRAANISKRYTGQVFGTYDETSIQQNEEVIFSLPKNGWEAADRVGLVTLPAIIAAAELIGAVTFTASAGIQEIIARMLGLSAYSRNIIEAAGKRAANISKRYTKGMFGEYTNENIKVHEDIIFSLPKDGWGVADRVGLFTFPAIIATVELTAAVVFTGTAETIETIGRMAGFSAYGRNIIEAAGKRAANISKRYTKGMFGEYTNENIKEHEYIIFSQPKDRWGVADRFGLFTFPAVIAAVEITGAVAFTGIAGILETIGRMAGFSAYSRNIIEAAGKRAANISKRYTGQVFGTYDEKSIQQNEEVIFSLPKNGWKAADRVGLVTLPAIIAAAELVGAIAFTASAGIQEIIARMLGLSAYGGHIIEAAGKRAANISKRYTKGMFGEYTNENIKVHEDIIFSLPKDGWGTADRFGLLTVPAVISIAEIVLATAFTVTAGIFESASRMLGISNRSAKGISTVFSKCGNMFGKSDTKNLESNIETVKAPVRSWWDVCDSIGTVVTGTASVGISVALAPLALLGFSKSNYHRFNYYKHRIDNDLQERQGKHVDRHKEEYHYRALKEGEQTNLGKFFSKVNVFNVLGHALYYTARFVVAPVIYGTLRTIKQLGGLVPVTKAIYQAIHPTTYDLTYAVDRVRKRFADLKKSLDEFGHLPLSQNGTPNIDVKEGLNQAAKRNILSRVGFSLFSEGRKIFSLGHTAEERILAAFKDRFEEFVRAYKNKGVESKDIQVNRFFTHDNHLTKGERFSYDHMVQRIKGSFSSLDDRQAIDSIAHLLKTDLEREMNNILGNEPTQEITESITYFPELTRN